MIIHWIKIGNSWKPFFVVLFQSLVIFVAARAAVTDVLMTWFKAFTLLGSKPPTNLVVGFLSER